HEALDRCRRLVSLCWDEAGEPVDEHAANEHREATTNLLAEREDAEEDAVSPAATPQLVPRRGVGEHGRQQHNRRDTKKSTDHVGDDEDPDVSSAKRSALADEPVAA